jgi:hypothetical protein
MVGFVSVLFVNVALEDLSDMTNSVVAICVVFVPALAVGAIGVPVREGDADGAFVRISFCSPKKLPSISVFVSGTPLFCVAAFVEGVVAPR